jgi:Tol biopolymer transport system component
MTKWILVLLLGLSAGVAVADVGDSQSALTPERAVKYRRISDPHFSADGSSAVFVVSQVNGPQTDLHIWMADVKRGELHQLTNSPKTERSPEWSPRDDSVAFVSNRGGRPQVYVIARQGGEARAVTSNPAGVSAFHWSPDGREIAYLARESGSELDANAPHIADREEDLERLWIIDVATGGGASPD